MSRTILVTGSSSGIGLTVTKHLLQKGHEVIGLSRRSHREEGKFTHYEVDLNDLKNLPEHLKKIEKAHQNVDALFLNAGYGEIATLEQMSYESIHRLITLNLTQHIFVTKAFIPLLRKKAYANIIFLASTSGLKGSARFTTYCASKHGIRGFADSIREECRTTNIHVTTLSPGMIRTHFFDDLPISPSENPYEAINVEDFEPIFDLLFNLRPGTVIEEMIIRPQNQSAVKKPTSKLS